MNITYCHIYVQLGGFDKEIFAIELRDVGNVILLFVIFKALPTMSLAHSNQCKNCIAILFWNSLILFIIIDYWLNSRSNSPKEPCMTQTKSSQTVL